MRPPRRVEDLPSVSWLGRRNACRAIAKELREIARQLRTHGAHKAAAAVSRAVKSTEGAARHAESCAHFVQAVEQSRPSGPTFELPR